MVFKAAALSKGSGKCYLIIDNAAATGDGSKQYFATIGRTSATTDEADCAAADRPLPAGSHSHSFHELGIA